MGTACMAVSSLEFASIDAANSTGSKRPEVHPGWAQGPACLYPRQDSGNLGNCLRGSQFLGVFASRNSTDSFRQSVEKGRGSSLEYSLRETQQILSARA